MIRENLSRNVPEWGVGHAMDVISTQGHDGCGVTAGSQTSQVVGVDYLDRMDHFVKEVLHVRGYGRYMDDAILIHEDASFLDDALQELAFLLSDVGLRMHPEKTRVIPVWEPFTFLGFTFRLTDSGKVLMTLRGESVGRMKRRVSRLARLEAKGLREIGTSGMAYEGWRSHAIKGCSHLLVAECDEWYVNLQKGNEC